ncbi:MAG: DUF4446 family protein [Syntrophomonadaceae bacterium]|nr:DUF4446 family protein [Syntrophomonadaceae bacterium]
MQELYSIINNNITWVQMALTIIFLLLILFVWRRNRKNDKLLRYYSGLMESYQEGNLESILQQVTTRQISAEQQLYNLEKRIEHDEKRMMDHINHIGLVRYKAFREVGGDLSFSVALLNDYGTGLVLTGIHGSQETRVYSKEVVRFASSHPLSQEEKQAINQARNTGGMSEKG